jgi:hypothetical protein
MGAVIVLMPFCFYFTNRGNYRKLDKGFKLAGKKKSFGKKDVTLNLENISSQKSLKAKPKSLFGIDLHQHFQS